MNQQIQTTQKKYSKKLYKQKEVIKYVKNGITKI